MAALYLHNAIFTPEASESSIPASPDPYTPHHGRHRSSHSSFTVAPSFRTSTSEFSHPTEPLLHPEISGSHAYSDLLSRQPAHPSGPQPGWDMGLSLVGDQPTMRERKDFWERTVKKRLRRLRFTKLAMEMLLGAWATYNAIRYFIAYAFYTSSTAQTVSLALGSSTTFSVALLLTSALIASFAPHLISARMSNRFLHAIRVTLRYLASFFLLGPAIVSFVLLFLWRNASDPDLRFRGRCHFDIDVVWTGPGSRCEPHAPAWGAWLAASIVRLVFTFGVIVVYHFTSRAYSHTRRPSERRNSRTRRQSIYKPSYVVETPAVLSPTFQTMMSSSTTLPASAPVSLKLTENPSSTTLVEQSRSRRISGDKKSLRSTRSRTGSFKNPSSTGHISRNSSDADLSSSGENMRIPSTGTGLSISPASSNAPHSPDGSSPVGPDAELFGFVDRFKSLVTQVSREVDDGLEIVRRDGYTPADITPPPSSYYEPPSSQSLSPEVLEHLNIYDQFGSRAQSPEEHVRVLGGYIRRMPTIESLGSREMGSLNSSLHRDGMFGSVHTQSHPPTRTNTISEATPSRNSSLNASSAATGGHRNDSNGSGSGGTTSASYHSAQSGIGMPIVDSPIPFAGESSGPVALASRQHSGDSML